MASFNDIKARARTQGGACPAWCARLALEARSVKKNLVCRGPQKMSKRWKYSVIAAVFGRREPKCDGAFGFLGFFSAIQFEGRVLRNEDTE
jgi:hypothetical protein